MCSGDEDIKLVFIEGDRRVCSVRSRDGIKSRDDAERRPVFFEDQTADRRTFFFQQREPHIGMRLGKTLCDVGHKKLADRQREKDRQWFDPVAQHRLRFSELAQRVIHFCEHFFGGFDQAQALVRQPHAARVVDEKRTADLCFQLFHRGVERLLRKMHLLARFVDRAETMDEDEIAQLFKLHEKTLPSVASILS